MLKHKIYISYAEADEEWVIQFIRWLKVYLRKQLGTIDENLICAKYFLKDNIIAESQKCLDNADILITILSPAYLRLNQNIEIDDFLNKKGENSGHIFVIEHNKVKCPKNIENFYGYKFWYEDDRENIHILGMPQLKDKESKYYQKIDEVARDLAKEIEELGKKQLIEEGKLNDEDKHVELLHKKKELKEKLWQQLIEELEAAYDQLSSDLNYSNQPRIKNNIKRLEKETEQISKEIQEIKCEINLGAIVSIVTLFKGVIKSEV